MLVKKQSIYPNIHVCTRVQVVMKYSSPLITRKKTNNADGIQGVVQTELKIT